MRSLLSISISLALVASTIFLSEATPLQYTGVNEAGADFGVLPGTYGVTYEYPTFFSLDHFISKGVNIFRIPFLWERMQPVLNASLDPTEFGRLDNVVQHITQQKTYALLDPHNYDKWNGVQIGSGNVTFASFTYFWQELAGKYASNPYVIFGLMNEPNSETTEIVLQSMQAGMNGIRASGAKNLVTVPGNAWTGGDSWTQNWYGTANSQVMNNIVDPANNFVFEMHQYLDSDYSGTSATCQSSTIGSQSLEAATAWLKSVGKKAFLGEFGGGANQVCYDAMNDMLNYMEANSDAWIGFTYWAAGPMWGDYIFSVEPYANGTDMPQFVNVLSKHIQTSGSSSSTTSTSTSTSTTTIASTTISTSTSTSSTTKSSSSTTTTSSPTKSSSSTTTTSSSVTSTTTTPTSGASTVSSSVSWSSSGGYGINIQVTFTNGVSNGWSVSFTLANSGDTISSVWNAVIGSSSGATYTLNAPSYDMVMSAGQSVAIGFNVNSSANNAKVPPSISVKIN